MILNIFKKKRREDGGQEDSDHATIQCFASPIPNHCTVLSALILYLCRYLETNKQFYFNTQV